MFIGNVGIVVFFSDRSDYGKRYSYFLWFVLLSESDWGRQSEKNHSIRRFSLDSELANHDFMNV